MRTHRVARLVAILLFLGALVYFCGGMAVGLSLWSRGLGAGWGSGFSGWLAIPILAGTLFGAFALLVFGAILYFLARIDTNLAAVRQNPPVSVGQPAGAGATVAGETALDVPPETAPALAEPIMAGTVAAVAVAATREEAPPVVEAETGASPEPAELAAAAVVAGGVAAGVAHEDEAPPAETAIASEAGAAAAIGGPQVEIGPLEAPEPAAPAVAAAEASPPQTGGAPAASDLQAELPAVVDAAPQEFSGKLPGADEAARIASEMSGGGDLRKPNPGK